MYMQDERPNVGTHARSTLERSHRIRGLVDGRDDDPLFAGNLVLLCKALVRALASAEVVVNHIGFAWLPNGL